MKTILSLLLLISIALAHPNVQSKEARKPPSITCSGWDCNPDPNGPGPHGPGPNWPGPHGPDGHGHPHRHCDDPCYDCNEPEVYTQLISPTINQDVTEDTLLICTSDSYFDYIRYNGVYEDNTTCNGVLVEAADYIPGLYVGGRFDSNGKPTEEALNAKDYSQILTINNGNVKRLEQTKLTDCKCEGNVLRSIGSWVATNPLTGCCNEGVNHVLASDILLNIYGECCSECYLVQSSLSWRTPVKN